MKLIVGLGNPGTKYKKNRHNAGFIAIDSLLSTVSGQWQGKKFDAEWARNIFLGEDCLFLKPLTYMNLSGKAVGLALRFHKIVVKDVLVLHDDIDVPCGKTKSRTGGGHGGHNGIRSLLDELSDESFSRIKLGVGRPEGKHQPIADWVLSDFTTSELEELQGPMIKDAIVRIENLFLHRDAE